MKRICLKTPTTEAEDRLKNASVKWSDMVFTRHGPDCRSLRNERSLNSYGWRKIDRRLVVYTQILHVESGLGCSSDSWLFLRIAACMHVLPGMPTPSYPWIRKLRYFDTCRWTSPQCFASTEEGGMEGRCLHSRLPESCLSRPLHTPVGRRYCEETPTRRD